eukprot:1144225-Pelagomonas_calceolata.AAC.1
MSGNVIAPFAEQCTAGQDVALEQQRQMLLLSKQLQGWPSHLRLKLSFESGFYKDNIMSRDAK